jgi:hypothetical protein
MPEKAKPGKKSPLKVIAVIVIGLALFAGGFFGVHFGLPYFLNSGISYSIINLR